MENTYKIVVGDWSEDGHNQWQFFYFKCNATQEQIKKAYLDAVKASGLALSRYDPQHVSWPEGVTPVLSEHEENMLTRKNAEKFKAIGVDIADYGLEEDVFYAEHVARLFLDMVKSQLEGFEYEIVDDKIPCINGFWSKDFNISIGYGALSP